MRIATWNVNGIRAAARKGFTESFSAIGADVLLLQETRAHPEQVPAGLLPAGWHAAWRSHSRPGYAGVAVWSRWPIEELDPGPDAPDCDGRLLWASVAGVRVCSMYLPSGSSGPERQVSKEAWMSRARPWLDRVVASPEPVLVAGDLNIAHTEHDVHSWKRAGVLSGFLPHERTWFADMLAAGWTDCVRHVHGPGPGPWSWWSNRGRARDEDRGWRIDYVLANAAAAARLRSAHIERAAGIRCSDHAPVVVALG